MTRKPTYDQRQPDIKLLIWGCLMLLAAWPAHHILRNLYQAFCPKLMDGGCEMGSALFAGFLIYSFTTLWLIVAIIITIVGANKYARSKPYS
jgi:hypothetical protein